jgi:hypothetical protein
VPPVKHFLPAQSKMLLFLERTSLLSACRYIASACYICTFLAHYTTINTLPRQQTTVTANGTILMNRPSLPKQKGDCT